MKTCLDIIRGLFRSRTFWANGLVFLAAVFASNEIRQFVDPVTLVKVQAALNILLRLITTRSVLDKGRG